MPLIITAENFDNEEIARLIDTKEELNEILGYCYKHKTDILVAKYIDINDDTVLNSMQIEDLLIDIDNLRKVPNLVGEECNKRLDELIKLCNIALEEPHRYLKFYGD